MIVLHAVFPIDPEKRERALDLIDDLVEHSNQEAGMIEYRVAADISDPNVLRFFEQYEDQAAFEAHTETNHFQEFETVLPELLAGEPDVRRFEVDSMSNLEL